MSSPERERWRKKRKRSAAAAGEIKAQFDDVIGQVAERTGTGSCTYACEVRDKENQLDVEARRGQGEQSVDNDIQAKLGAVFDAIKVAVRHKGKKSKPWLTG